MRKKNQVLQKEPDFVRKQYKSITLAPSTSLRWHHPDQVQRVKELSRVLLSVQAIGLP